MSDNLSVSLLHLFVSQTGDHDGTTDIDFISYASPKWNGPLENSCCGHSSLTTTYSNEDGWRRVTTTRWVPRSKISTSYISRYRRHRWGRVGRRREGGHQMTFTSTVRNTNLLRKKNYSLALFCESCLNTSASRVAVVCLPHFFYYFG